VVFGGARRFAIDSLRLWDRAKYFFKLLRFQWMVTCAFPGCKEIAGRTGWGSGKGSDLIEGARRWCV